MYFLNLYPLCRQRSSTRIFRSSIKLSGCSLSNIYNQNIPENNSPLKFLILEEINKSSKKKERNKRKMKSVKKRKEKEKEKEINTDNVLLQSQCLFLLLILHHLHNKKPKYIFGKCIKT